MIEALGISGIALAIEYSTRWGQIMQWYSYLWMRFPIGSLAEKDFYSVLDSMISRKPIMKILGFCPVCMSFWASVVLFAFGLIGWETVGMSFIFTKLFLKYAD